MKFPRSRTPLFPAAATAVLVAFGAFYACSDDTSSEGPAATPERKAVLESTAECSATIYASFLQASKALTTSTQALADAPEDASALAAAQDAWKKAMAAWEQAEVLQFGPAGKSGTVDSGGSIGGADLRDLVYSWTLVNSCRVDQVLVAESYKTDLASEAVNALGLDALEYLLFYRETDSTCPETVDIVSGGTWAQVTDLAARRADYSYALAQLVEGHAQTLVDAWSDTEGSFRQDFVNAGESGVFSAQADAIDAAVRALLYLDLVMKDLKLAEPLGLSVRCATETCPESIEHQYAGVSKSSISANVEGLRQVFFGCGSEAFGFSDLLVSMGYESYSEDIEAAFAAIDAALQDIDDEDLRVTLASSPEKLQALHDAVKSLTDVLKNELVATLEVQLASVGGDND